MMLLPAVFALSATVQAVSALTVTTLSMVGAPAASEAAGYSLSQGGVAGDHTTWALVAVPTATPDPDYMPFTASFVLGPHDLKISEDVEGGGSFEENCSWGEGPTATCVFIGPTETTDASGATVTTIGTSTEINIVGAYVATLAGAAASGSGGAASGSSVTSTSSSSGGKPTSGSVTSTPSASTTNSVNPPTETKSGALRSALSSFVTTGVVMLGLIAYAM